VCPFDWICPEWKATSKQRCAVDSVRAVCAVLRVGGWWRWENVPEALRPRRRRYAVQPRAQQRLHQRNVPGAPLPLCRRSAIIIIIIIKDVYIAQVRKGHKCANAVTTMTLCDLTFIVLSLCRALFKLFMCRWAFISFSSKYNTVEYIAGFLHFIL